MADHITTIATDGRFSARGAPQRCRRAPEGSVRISDALEYSSGTRLYMAHDRSGRYLLSPNDSKYDSWRIPIEVGESSLFLIKFGTELTLGVLSRKSAGIRSHVRWNDMAMLGDIFMLSDLSRWTKVRHWAEDNVKGRWSSCVAMDPDSRRLPIGIGLWFSDKKDRSAAALADIGGLLTPQT